MVPSVTLKSHKKNKEVSFAYVLVVFCQTEISHMLYPPSERFILSGVNVSDRRSPAPAAFTLG